jgi:hypothetical protein
MNPPAAESSPLLAQYMATAEAYGDAVNAGDPERVNTAHAAIQAAFQTFADRDLPPRSRTTRS